MQGVLAADKFFCSGFYNFFAVNRVTAVKWFCKNVVLYGFWISRKIQTSIFLYFVLENSDQNN